MFNLDAQHLEIFKLHLNINKVRMAEWSKALRSGRSPLLWAWVRIPLLTYRFYFVISLVMENDLTFLPFPSI